MLWVCLDPKTAARIAILSQFSHRCLVASAGHSTTEGHVKSKLESRVLGV